MSRSKVEVVESTIVAIVDDQDRIGWGEACLASPLYQSAHTAGVRAALDLIAPAVIGLDPLAANQIQAAMQSELDGHAEARSAIDIACWDLSGQQLGVHVVDLLGGSLQEQVLTYHVVGILEPDAAADEAQRLQNAGITRLQLKAGGRPVERDIQAIHAVVDVLGSTTDLAVDANRGWSRAEALQVSQACRGLRLSLEQPCATESDLLAIKPGLCHPLVVDESASDLPTIARMISSGLADGFGLKLSRLGGLTPMRAARDLCAATGIPMSSDDAWGGDIVAAAGVALGSTLPPRVSRGAWISHPYHGVHYDPTNGPEVSDGHVTLPRGGPGLGLRLDPDAFGPPIAVYR